MKTKQIGPATLTHRRAGKNKKGDNPPLQTPPLRKERQIMNQQEIATDWQPTGCLNGNGRSHSTPPVPADVELNTLDEQELKAAIKSAWKKVEHLAKKNMGPLLYWLRVRLRAQGSRNDIHDKDRGFGAWVEDNLDISRRTADRWADEYGLQTGLLERNVASTSGHVTKSSEDEFYEKELQQHGVGIQFTYWVTPAVHVQYERAVETIKKHFQIGDDKEAVVKAVCYAAEIITSQSQPQQEERSRRPHRKGVTARGKTRGSTLSNKSAVRRERNAQ